MDDTAQRTIRRAPAQRWWLTLPVLCVAVLVVQVDTSIVNLGIQPIGNYFSVDTGALQWVVDGYNLFYAALLLTGGQLADMYGRRRLFMTGVAVFTTASVLCALAPSIAFLIGARALAGFGAALLLPATLAIIRVVWSDPAERGRALGIWAGCNGLALAIGPPIGGWLISAFGWRSIFLAAVPLGGIALALSPWAMPESTEPQSRHLDLPGQLLGTIALAGVAVAVIEARHLPIVAASAFAVAALALMWFVRIEAKMGRKALVPMDVFRVSRFNRAMMTTAGMTFGMYGVLFLLPMTWQATGQLSALGAGIGLLPMALVFVVTSPFSGALVARLGARIVTSGGVAIIACGLLLIGATAHAEPIIGAEIGCALTGLGMGLATGPLLGVAVGAVPAARSGTASALINVARMTGATLGVAVLGTLFALTPDARDGLRLAMLFGGCVQLLAAAAMWSVRHADAMADG